MVGEVVPDEGVEKVGVASQVCAGDGDELAVAGVGRVVAGTGEQVAGCRRHQGRGHEQERGVVRRRPGEDLAAYVVAADEAVQQGLGVLGHVSTVGGTADGALTIR